eukprot:Tbor_TRINITY_DN5388_c3_g3::TRINITY_DN5388_c3_g3_i1::g.4380::m.4380
MGKPYNRNGGGGPFSRGNNNNNHNNNRGRGMPPQHGRCGPSSGSHHSGGGGGGGRGPGGRGNGNTSDRTTTNLLMATMGLYIEKHVHNIYDPNTGTITLSMVRDQPDVQSIKESIDFNSKNFCDGLVKVFNDKGMIPRLLILDGNGITSPAVLMRSLILQGFGPTVTGFNFANNKISNCNFVGELAGFPNLTDLYFVNNAVHAQGASYIKAITKKAPSLRFLDNVLVERAALMLPQPLMASPQASEIQVLQYIESAIFGPMLSRDKSALGFVLHPDVVFTLSLSSSFRIQCRSSDSAVRQDLSYLKRKLQDRSRNLRPNAGGNVTTVVKGRVQVISDLVECLYCSKFDVGHELLPYASVIHLEGSQAKVPTYHVVLHGRMYWSHFALPSGEPPVTAYFDRSMSLVLCHNSNTLQVTNDMIRIRKVVEEQALLRPQAPAEGQPEQ